MDQTTKAGTRRATKASRRRAAWIEAGRRDPHAETREILERADKQAWGEEDLAAILEAHADSQIWQAEIQGPYEAAQAI